LLVKKGEKDRKIVEEQNIKNEEGIRVRAIELFTTKSSDTILQNISGNYRN